MEENDADQEIDFKLYVLYQVGISCSVVAKSEEKSVEKLLRDIKLRHDYKVITLSNSHNRLKNIAISQLIEHGIVYQRHC